MYILIYLTLFTNIFWIARIRILWQNVHIGTNPIFKKNNFDSYFYPKWSTEFKEDSEHNYKSFKLPFYEYIPDAFFPQSPGDMNLVWKLFCIHFPIQDSWTLCLAGDMPWVKPRFSILLVEKFEGPRKCSWSIFPSSLRGRRNFWKVYLGMWENRFTKTFYYLSIEFFFSFYFKWKGAE